MSPKIRQGLYSFGVVVFTCLTLLSTYNIIDPSTAAGVSSALTSILGLFGVTLAGTAAYNLKDQRQNKVFDKVDPEDQVINGLNEIIARKQSVQEADEKIKGAILNAVKDVPVLGSLAQEAIDSLPQ